MKSMKYNPGKIHAHVSERGNSHLLAAIFTLVTILNLGMGCTDDLPSVSAVESIDACTLLTRTDAEAVLEITLQEPRKKQYGGGEAWISSCHYDSIPDEAQIRRAGLLLGPHHASEGPSKAYADYEASLKSELGNDFKMEVIEDIGDKAGWFDDGLGGQLTIFQGVFRLIVSSSETDTNTSLINQKLLAKKVLGRLLLLEKD